MQAGALPHRADELMGGELGDRVGISGPGLGVLALRALRRVPEHRAGGGDVHAGLRGGVADGLEDRRTRARDLEQRLGLRLGQALDALGRHQIDQQRDAGLRQQLVSLQAYNSHAACLDHPGQRRRRGGD